MSNIFQNTSSGQPLLKTLFLGPIQSQFNDNVPLWRGAELGKEKWSGEKIIRPLKVRRNQGIGATSDGGNLPPIGRQTTVRAEISAKYNYLRFGVTGPMIKASQSDVGSYVRIQSYEIQEGLKDLQNDVNRQLGYDGTGSLARMNAAVVASNVIVAKGRTNAEDGNKFLDVGALLDIYSSAGVLKASAVEVTAMSVSGSLATLTLSAAVTAAADDLIVHSGSYNTEIQGLLYALDGATTSIYGVDRSVYTTYQGAVIDASAQLNLDIMKQTHNLGLRRGGAKYKAIWTDFDSERYYEKLLVPDKRFINKVKGDGSFADKDKSYLEYSGLPMVVDKDAPLGMVWLSEGSLVKYILCDMDWADDTGAMYIAQSEQDELEARLRFFANLFNAQPNSTPRLHNYTSP
jgi:hypothetical protein